MGQDLQKLWPMEANFMMALYDMERRGVLIDQELCKSLSLQAEEAMQAIETNLGFKPSETTALKHFLIEELKMPVLHRSEKTGNPSFNKAVMEEYDLRLRASNDNRARQVLEYRGWQKANSACYNSYLKLVSPDGRIHPNFKMHGTITTRLSCEVPNLQQIPRKTDKPWNGEVKRCFIEQEGWTLIEFDYKTLEFMIGAMYTKDADLISQINDGVDFHQVVANRLNVDRHVAKNGINFPLLYGAGVDKIAFTLKAAGYNRPAREIYSQFHKEFPKFNEVMFDVQRKAEERGYIKYWTGRRKHYGTYWNRGQEHKAFNALCQGGGAEVVKHSIVKTKNIEDDNAKQLLTVHDSVLWKIRKSSLESYISKITNAMEDFDFPVKLKVDAHVWGEQ